MTLEQARQYFPDGQQPSATRSPEDCPDIDELRRMLRKLEAQNAALREADRRKDAFFAELGHELRNPLGSIRLAVEMLRINDASERASAIEIIARQTLQLTRLIDDLLDLARIKHGKILLRKQLVDLANVLDLAVETVRPVIVEKRHALSIDYPHGELLLEGDAARLEQIVVNLLANAANYTPPGGRLSLSTKRSGDELLIAICDNGTGISAENLNHIFEPFAQGDHVTGDTQGGLGLGLALVKKLAELHGGSVSATSNGAGLGAEFTVRLRAATSGKWQPESLLNAAATAKALQSSQPS
jgi:signal transduction histidine kinase